MRNRVYILLSIVFLFHSHFSAAQDVCVKLLNYSHSSYKASVIVENHLEDSISYVLCPSIKIDGHWIPFDYSINDDLKDPVNVICSPKHWYIEHILSEKNSKVHNGHIYDSLIALYIYYNSEELHNVSKYDKRFRRLLKKKIKRYDFDEAEKKVRLIGENIRTKEKLLVYSEVFR